MEIGYNVWLYGTNTKIAIDASSEVATTSLPAVAEPDWVKCHVLTVRPTESELDDADDRHGVMADTTAKKVEYELKFYPFAFPDGMADLEKVYAVFRKRYKYLCINGQGQAAADKYPYAIHGAGRAIQVVCTGRDIDHDNGKKTLTLNLRKKKPLIPTV